MIPKAIREEQIETRLLITHAQGVLERAAAAMAAADVVLDAAEADIARRIGAPSLREELLRLYHHWRHYSASGDFVPAARITFRQCADELNAILLTETR
jgi:hypothetical protein